MPFQVSQDSAYEACHSLPFGSQSHTHSPLFQHHQIAAVEWCGTTRPGQTKKERSAPRALFPDRAYYQPSPA
ncbi:uncharacterized protein SPAR_L04210 [Saccharomyces paradoxus]|uniref:Uncharacterized protein n=1 Tax=Saccharomyces paradoxus TaxID=27291 RepID=A0A8B8UWK1_SACPA|nr:uncharacterized protein SPAR_L04210 [Saccharomyces paradoxus]QHS75113.1 hypothetical protein SPAR_L04210 [Saccharomyces paradoxus]